MLQLSQRNIEEQRHDIATRFHPVRLLLSILLSGSSFLVFFQALRNITKPTVTMAKNKRSLPDSSSSDEDVLLSDDERKTATGGGKKKKKPRRPQYDEARKKEIRETNKLAARECRARKKRLMSELEKTVGSLTAEHSALVKQNRELTIRLETLQRTIGPPPAGGLGSSVSSTTPQLATVANSATSLLSGLNAGGGQQPAMNSNLMMPNAAQMALLAQLNTTNPGFQVSSFLT